MKPIAIDAIQMTQESLPTVAATAPMENSTSGGTPLATQNAPVQSMPRSSPGLFAAPAAAASSAAALILQFPSQKYSDGAASAPLISRAAHGKLKTST